ncbi:hypothetical protein PYW07_012530 [Mythimna separata]|uniref:Endonuclease/exonuclease/phosphatase domain-containing protein n=1 Tax=Mythimna separata TaxID=271217 RepID=A0AAD7Y8D3_MYTSE|nr:hypothetical protein PYW07_012530 [Mythimna separata]
MIDGGGHTAKAGVYLHRRDLACAVLRNLSTDHCVVAHIEECDLHVVSAYFQYAEDISRHLHHLERVMGELHGKRVLLCLDANTHSPMWHSEPRHYTGRGHNAEYRRVSMEGFVAAHGLIIHNVEGQPCTFGGPNGESNIDLTLSTRSVTAVDWKVHEGASSSDHRLITFQVIAGGTGGRGNCRGAEPTEEPVRFRDRGVDWLRFRQTIHARMGRLDLSKPAPFVCRDFTRAIVDTASQCLGAKGSPKDAGYEWWNPELDKLRKSTNKARYKWQGARKEGGLREEGLRAEFHVARARYRKAMEGAELEYFRRIADSGNADPWGLAYRAASGRLRPSPRVINGTELAEGFATTVGDAATGLLRVLCPDDDPLRDTPYHKQGHMQRF